MKVLPYPRDPRYRVSDEGDVWSRLGRKLKGELHETKTNGTAYRRIRIDGHWHYVHHMVLETFKGPKPEGLCRRHKNGDSLDNHLTNLEYSTYSVNNHDRVRDGHHHNAKKTKCHKGHEFTEDNIYYNTVTGARQCRACMIDRRPAYNERRRARRAKARSEHTLLGK